MKTGNPRAWLAAVTAAAMSYLYLQFVWSVATAFLLPATLVEGLVIGSQLTRIAASFLWPRLRRASPLVVAGMFAIEAFLLLVLGLLSVLTANPIYPTLSSQVFEAWVASLIVLSPSLMIFRYARLMYGPASLSTLLPASAFLLALLFSLQGVQASTSSNDSLRALVVSFIGRASGTPTGALASDSAYIEISAVAVFFAVATYSVIRDNEDSGIGSSALSLGLMGMLVALGWGSAASFISSNATLVFTVPTAFMGGSLWWLTREKRG